MKTISELKSWVNKQNKLLGNSTKKRKVKINTIRNEKGKLTEHTKIQKIITLRIK